MTSLLNIGAECPPKDICRSLTIPEQLQEKKQRLTKELEEVNKTIEFFSKHPEIQEGIQLLGSCLRY